MTRYGKMVEIAGTISGGERARRSHREDDSLFQGFRAARGGDHGAR